MFYNKLSNFSSDPRPRGTAPRRPRDEDIDEVLEQIPDDRKEEAASWMRDCRRIAAGNIENDHNL